MEQHSASHLDVSMMETTFSDTWRTVAVIVRELRHRGIRSGLNELNGLITGFEGGWIVALGLMVGFVRGFTVNGGFLRRRAG